MAEDGETLASLTINSIDGFTGLRQPRISGARVTPISDAGTSLVLLGISLVTLGALGRTVPSSIMNRKLNAKNSGPRP